jgi:RNA polymerase sigma factor (TIGR02999 family)
VTRLLCELKNGNRAAEEALIPLVYGELRRLAAYYLRGEKPGHTLQATALVHEAYLRLTTMDQVTWKDRCHFFALSAQVMRRILVDHARARTARKRGGSREDVPLDDVIILKAGPGDELVAVDAALEKLARMDARQCKIVEMRFFGGLTEEEIGIVLGVSARTVKREWRIAKAWLYRELSH